MRIFLLRYCCQSARQTVSKVEFLLGPFLRLCTCVVHKCVRACVLTCVFPVCIRARVCAGMRMYTCTLVCACTYIHLYWHVWVPAVCVHVCVRSILVLRRGTCCQFDIYSVPLRTDKCCILFVVRNSCFERVVLPFLQAYMCTSTYVCASICVCFLPLQT